MNDDVFRSLWYVKNTNGLATKEDFIEDWSPIGSQLWQIHESKQLVEEKNGKIFVTPLGLQVLSQ
jgi:hypothetical protein